MPENLIPPFTIGIDLGGTNTELGIVDSQGNILFKDRFPTATPDFESWSDLLSEKLSNAVEGLGLQGKIAGAGIGAPCANTTTGCIEAATDLPWPSPIPLVEILEIKLGLPVVIGNDANAASIGEMIYGSARGVQNFIVITLGTGVGAGIVCDGHLLNGRNGFAGELGHITFDFAADRKCGCGRYGCLQTVASAKGIVETARRFGFKNPADPDNPDFTAKDVTLAAEHGDETAKRVFDFTGECLGKALAQYAAFTDPEAIILFGGVANARNLLLNPTIKSFNENALHLYAGKVNINISTLKGADAAILGTAALPYIITK
ncbi:MAG: ROK family protein [Muribaculaceae bacterium]|nr:ROK family protein [Muribaculaceae bacterium]